MRIPSIVRSLLLLALCASCAPGLKAQDPARGIVFSVVVTEEGDAWMNPVATLTANGFRAPADPVEADSAGAFRARWMMPGTRYDVLSRGVAIGSVVADSAGEVEGCGDLSVRGSLDVRVVLNEGWEGLAGEGLPEQRDAPWLRDVEPAEKRGLDGMAAALFRAHRVDDSAGNWADTVTVALIGHPNARPVLVGGYILKTVDPGFAQAAVFVIAEDGDDGDRPAYTWFHQGVDADVESRRLVDAADLDGDGVPELVVRNSFYESWSYTVLKRTPEGWAEVYTGGGGGC
jgi:hypothetical protein